MTTAMTINTSEDLLKRKISMFTGDEIIQGGPNHKIQKTVDIPLENEDSDFAFPFDYEDDVDDDMENFEDIIDTSVVSVVDNTNDNYDNYNYNAKDNNDNTNNNNSTSNQQQIKEPNESQHLSQAAPQRKKPGRKPNPASPALRKAQNRAAQRAFRERKERHLRDLENTIQSLRAYQTETVNKFHREREHLQSLITRFEIENNYFKQIVLNFECALNSINGNNEASTKIKNSVMRNFASLNVLNNNNNNNQVSVVSSLPPNPPTQQPQQPQTPQQQLQQLQQQQLLQVPSINLTLSSPTSSSIIPSPEPGNLSSPVSSPPSTPDSLSSNKSNRPYLIDNNLLVNSRDVKFPTSSSSPTSNDVSNIISNFSNNISSNTTTSNNSNNNSNLIYQNGGEDQSLVKSFTTNPLFSQYSKSTNIYNSSTTTVNSENNNNNITNLPDPNNLINLNSNLTFDTQFFFNSGNFQAIDDIKNINFGTLNLSPTRQQSILGNMGPRALTREEKQLIKLATVMGSTDYSVPLEPILRRTLTPQQKYYLTLPHDPRIDFIPCLHLRSRMIQFQGFYDLYELIELLLAKANCHGDPIDPDSWECPQEFFDRYPYLVLQHCRIKTALYQKYGKLPSNFSEYQFDDE
ncbi:hypothetical protein Glove_326g61 [Diversispora epigaea]|uniref:BZIP domain-containing protein n=1 Tax=Diversispora epigaea TaxID=1348612 RepID=A0A397HM20_9GLOM|nr:hypothetical protein Glove_326g61 [Diversispora epigaea]